VHGRCRAKVFAPVIRLRRQIHWAISVVQSDTAFANRPNLKCKDQMQFSLCQSSRSLAPQRLAACSFKPLVRAFPTRSLTSPSSGLAFGSPLK
jgi:hypothetical protein